MPFTPPSYDRLPHLDDFNPDDSIQTTKLLDHVDGLLAPRDEDDYGAAIEQVYDLTDLVALRDDALESGYDDLADELDDRFAAYFQDDIQRLEDAACPRMTPAMEAEAEQLGDAMIPGDMDDYADNLDAVRAGLEAMGLPPAIVDMMAANQELHATEDPEALRDALDRYGDAVEAMADQMPEPDHVRENVEAVLGEDSAIVQQAEDDAEPADREGPESVAELRYDAMRQALHMRIHPVGKDDPYLA